MLEFLSPESDDHAIAILKQDHDKVKDLFEQFERTDDRRRKKKIAAEAIMELKIHAAIEEEIFYPAVRPDAEDDIMNEADEEHHVAKLLIAELDQMDGSEDHFDAKFTVLAENIRHHIREEEGTMMPQVRKADIDFEVLGQKLLRRKQELMKNGVPASAEEKMISRFGQRADSPALAAKGKMPKKTAGGGAKKQAVKKAGDYSNRNKSSKAKAPARRSASAKRKRA